MSALKNIVRDCLPQALIRWIRDVRGLGVSFEGVYASWEEASADCAGYDADEILAKVQTATLKVKNGDAVYERDSVLFDEIEYAWPVLACLMWVAARSAGKLSVLDFGGSLGSCFFQYRKFLQYLPELRWNVVEQLHFVIAGRNHFQDELLRFYKTTSECLSENQPNVILMSSVLQYLSDPYSVLQELLSLNVSVFVIDRTCYLNHGDNDLIRVQHVPDSLYQANYPCRFFVENNVFNVFRANGFKLMESFNSLDKLCKEASWKGHIFIRDTLSLID
jgi:putative methyltransferase (TIGR04325 family)